MGLPKTKPVLLVHGGAWAMPDDAVAAHERGIAAALSAGWDALQRGGTSVDAVEAAVTVMEDDDTFDAGRGSFLTRDGRVQLDALLMNGENLRTGGVACVERLKNPIQAARLVLDKSPHVYFVGPGAERFATQNGMRLVDNSELIVPRERERLMNFQRNEAAGGPDTTFSGSSEFTTATPGLEEAALESEVDRALPETLRIDDPTLHSHDTVGAVALDQYGNLAAATSTGGTLSKAPGRVGDSSLIGCGCYADNLSAAVSLTGWGEPIMKLVLGKWAVDRVADGATPQQAATDAIAYLYSRLGGHGGIILLGPDGQLGLAHNTPRMAWGIADAQGQQLGITRNG
ncbi:MAG TPA: isoaspartyl peptidase/L-asparaginase [Acidobacteriaceae bacterium]|nr:isoaspartyl peptidase/L-asparaginase [Acidobacteriaceae bacterium]